MTSTEGPNIVAIDHVSWLDGPILFSLVETPATFVIEPQAAKRWPARLFLRFADAHVLHPAKPQSLRALVRKARSGRRLVFFLDIRTAIAGQSMASFDAAALIADALRRISHRRPSGRGGAHFFLAHRLRWPAPIPEDQGHHPAAAATSNAIRSALQRGGMREASHSTTGWPSSSS